MKKSPSLLYVRLQIFHDNTELIMNSSCMSFCKTSTPSTLTNIPMAFLPSIKKLYYSQCFGGLTPSRRPHGIYSSRSEFIISSRALCLNRVWVLASCKLAALIFTCIYPMVSTMTSYSSLTSRRIFVSRQHSTESDFEFPSMIKVFMKSCLFIVCKTMFTIGESQAISHANRTANTRTPNCQSSQGKIWHRKILWSENADLKFNGASNKDGDGINKQRSRGNITQWISNAKVL